MAFSIPAGFKNLGHYIASGAKKFVAFTKKADAVLPQILQNKDEIEAVTRVILPQAVEIEDTAFFCLGAFGEALDAVAGAVDGNGLNVKLDATAWDKIKAAIALVKQKQAAAPATA